jgi:hypothetical protein
VLALSFGKFLHLLRRSPTSFEGRFSEEFEEHFPAALANIGKSTYRQDIHIIAQPRENEQGARL